MTELRKQFEGFPEIAEILISEKWDFVDNDYIIYHDNELCLYVQGAWYAFQEQQKLIDRFVDIIHNAYMSDGNSSVEIIYDKIQELLK